MRNRVQHRRNNMDHNQENYVYNGPMNVVCPHYGALRFQGEPSNCFRVPKFHFWHCRNIPLLFDNYMKQILTKLEILEKILKTKILHLPLHRLEQISRLHQDVALIASDYRAKPTIMPATCTHSTTSC